jgi:hypothetical protein
VDPTTRKMLARIDELDAEMARLGKERHSIFVTLGSIGYRQPDAKINIPTSLEAKYQNGKPFSNMTLTDACLTVLRDQAKAKETHDQWLDKTQIEYLVVRGGYKFEAADSVNSIHVTLRRMLRDGLINASKGKGSRSSKYHFWKEREDDVNSRTTNK